MTPSSAQTGTPTAAPTAAAPTPVQAGREPRNCVISRSAELTSDEQTCRRQLSRINWALLLLLLLAAVVIRFSLLRASLWPMACAIAALAAAVVLRLRVRSRLTRVERLLAHYRQVLTRLDGQAESASRGVEFARDRHPYARDLNIVGEHSLFASLPPPRTGPGEAALAALLLDPVPLPVVRSRQQAVEELAPDLPLREAVALLGDTAAHTLSATRLRTWASAAPIPFPRTASAPLLVLSCLSVAVLLAAASHRLTWPLALSNIAAVSAVEALITLRLRTRVAASLAAADHLSREVRFLRETLAFLTAATPRAPLLTELRDAALGTAPPAPGSSPRLIASLESRLAFVDRRHQPWSILLSLLFAAGTQTAIALEHWRSLHGPTLVRTLDAWAGFDALNALAAFAFEHPENTYPVLDDIGSARGEASLFQTPLFQATGLRHPLLPPAAAVGNDISLGSKDGARLLLISGSNMSGKSTLLRAIGTAVVLGYAGAPIPATSARLSLFRLCASITPADSLAEGRSRFLAELEQLRAMLRPVPIAGTVFPPTLFLIDEILGGTNSADRLAAARSILDRLLAEGAIGAVSTHDLALTALADDPSLAGENRHMSSPDPADPLRFDFQLRPGINRVSSAPALIRLLGL